MMAYDFRKWIGKEGLNRRSPRLRRVYSTPLLLFSASLAIEFGDGFGSAWLSVLGSLLAVIAIVCALFVICSPFLRDVWQSATSSGDTVLDERERRAISEALAQSYVVLGAAILVALTYADLAHGFGWWLPGAEDLDALRFPVFAMIFILPIVIAEWSVPLPLADEEE